MGKKASKPNSSDETNQLNGTAATVTAKAPPKAASRPAATLAVAEPAIAALPATRPVAPVGKKKTVVKKKATAAPKAATSTAKKKKRPVISDDDIRVRAYLIAERRAQLSLPGDESTDWFDAKQQLEKEAGA